MTYVEDLRPPGLQAEVVAVVLARPRGEVGAAVAPVRPVPEVVHHGAGRMRGLRVVEDGGVVPPDREHSSERTNDLVAQVGGLQVGGVAFPDGRTPVGGGILPQGPRRR
jgi:hypothetical protein